jgi:hypothetical protein
MMTPVPQYEVWLQQALAEHRKFSQLIVQTKKHAFECGLFLLSAKHAAGHGEWVHFFETHNTEISIRTAQRYMKFADDCLKWAQLANPTVNKLPQLQSIARNMVLESAASFMELCREVGMVKGRAAEGARDGKRDPSEQLTFHFNFDAFDGLLLAVESTGDNPFTRVDREELAASRARAARVVALMDQALGGACVPRADSGVSPESSSNNFLPQSSGLTPNPASARF